MKKRSLTEGRMSEHGRGLGTVTREMVERRARELAVINGRPDGKPTTADFETAKEEMMGVEGLEAPPAENVSAAERWDPVPGTPGHAAHTTAAPDEQTFAEQLVEEGVREAEHERMKEGSEERKRRDLE